MLSRNIEGLSRHARRSGEAMSKIIIRNNSRISDIEALRCVSQVIDMGRQSAEGKCYTYVTTFINGIAVSAEVTKAGTDTFVIWEQQ